MIKGKKVSREYPANKLEDAIIDAFDCSFKAISCTDLH